MDRRNFIAAYILAARTLPMDKFHEFADAISRYDEICKENHEKIVMKYGKR